MTVDAFDGEEWDEERMRRGTQRAGGIGRAAWR